MRRDEAERGVTDATRARVDDRRTSGVRIFTILSVSSSDLDMLLVTLGSFPRAAKSGTRKDTRELNSSLLAHLDTRTSFQDRFALARSKFYREF